MTIDERGDWLILPDWTRHGSKWVGDIPCVELYSPMYRFVKYRTVMADLPTLGAPMTAIFKLRVGGWGLMIIADWWLECERYDNRWEGNCHSLLWNYWITFGLICCESYPLVNHLVYFHLRAWGGSQTSRLRLFLQQVAHSINGIWDVSVGWWIINQIRTKKADYHGLRREGIKHEA